MKHALWMMNVHAKRAVKYALEQAAEKAKVEWEPVERVQDRIDKDSILSLEEQIIKDLNL
jgi:hypothetical protein